MTKHQEAHILVPDSTSFNIKRAILTPKTYKIHSHKNFEMNYILSGWGNRFVGDNMHSFSRGDLVLLGPDLPHCWEVKGVSQDTMPECITIHFHENFFGQKIIQSPELLPVLNMFKEASLGIQFYGEEVVDVHYILHKMLKANNLRKLIYLFEIFEILIRTDSRKCLSSSGFLKQADSTDSKKLKKVYEYILVNFSKKVKLEEVAEICHLSQSAFCRFFERSTGKSLFNYLKEVRIGYACKLLQDSEMLISEICYQSGYSNLAHFNNQFKEICSVTPGQYRRQFNNVA